MSLTMREMQPGDIDNMKLSALAKAQRDAWTDFEAVKNYYQSLDSMCTYINADGEIIAVGGWVPMWTGVAELILFASEKFPNYYFEVMRFIKRIIVKDNLGYQRLQITTPVESMHERIAEFLGFQAEGILRKYVNGNDYYCYSRVI